MTQVVPEHVARAKLSSSGSASSTGSTTNNITNRKDKNRPHRSNSATLSTISVTCDTDTSIRSKTSRYQSTTSNPTKTIPIPTTNHNNVSLSHSSTTLMNVSINPPPTSFHNNHNHPYKSSGNSSSSMSTSLTTTSGMNIIHERLPLSSTMSTSSIPSRYLTRNSMSMGIGSANHAGGGAGSTLSTRSLSNKYKAASFDEHHRTSQSRGIGRSVLEHLVFVFPENVRRMLTGPKKYNLKIEQRTFFFFSVLFKQMSYVWFCFSSLF